MSFVLLQPSNLLAPKVCKRIAGIIGKRTRKKINTIKTIKTTTKTRVKVKETTTTMTKKSFPNCTVLME